MDIAVKINDLSITLGRDFKALSNVTADITQGSITGLIGPSGAGKTTLIRGIVGGLRVAKGSILVFGLPAGSPKLRQQVSYMTQELSIYHDLTVKENLHYFAQMMGQPKAKMQRIISDVLETVDMTNKATSLVSNLSVGQKQRVSLAVALISSPKLMILDEPTVGLDPVLRESLWQLFARLAAGGTTLVISSHSMDEAERCDDLMLIRDGIVIAHSSPQALLKSTGSTSVEQSFLKLVGDKR